MTSTTLPAPAAEAEQMSPADMARRVDQAADMIERDGLHTGGYFEGAWILSYAPGLRCCTVGALAVTCDITSGLAIDFDFCGCPRWDLTHNRYVEVDLHPLLAAVLRELGLHNIEQVFDWSDSSSQSTVVQALRGVACRLRGVASRGGAR